MKFFLLALLLSLFISDGSAQDKANQNPEQLAKIAQSYENSLRSGEGTAQSRNEVREHLGAVYYLLHRYRDSLTVLSPVLGAEANSGNTKPSGTLDEQSWTVCGLDYLELNELPQAIRALRHSLMLKPDSGNARLALGDALARSGKMEEAAKQYEAQTNRTPTLADAWYKLGLAHSQISVDVSRAPVKPEDRNLPDQLSAEELLSKGDTLNSARKLFRIAHRSPTQPGIQADLGSALLTLGYVKSAQDHFLQELTFDPESPLAELGLAQTAALAGDWAEVQHRFENLSQAHARQLIHLLEFPPAGLIIQASASGQLSPPESFTQSSAGALWKSWLSDSNLVPRMPSVRKVDSASCAEKHMRLGIWLTDDCYSKLLHQLKASSNLTARALAKLAEAQFRLGEYEATLKSAIRLRAVDPKNGWALYWQSKAHDAIAEECFLKIGELNPDSPRVHQMLAEHYLKLSDYPKAKTEFQNALGLSPDSADLHLGLGKVLSRTSEWVQAEQELHTALDLAPKSAFAHYELGHVYMQQSFWQQAIEQLRQVPEDSTVLLSARLDLAKAESETGHTADAIKDLLSVASLDQDGELYYRLAALYRQAGDQAKAQDALATFKKRRAASLQADMQEVGALERSRRSAAPFSHNHVETP